MMNEKKSTFCHLYCHTKRAAWHIMTDDKQSRMSAKKGISSRCGTRLHPASRMLQLGGRQPLPQHAGHKRAQNGQSRCGGRQACCLLGRALARLALCLCRTASWRCWLFLRDWRHSQAVLLLL